MGTSFNIKINESHKIDKIKQIEYSIDSILVSLNQQMSTWIEDSEISFFNQSRSGSPFRISDEFYHVLKKGKLINNQTSGAFDYTVFPLAQIWGFGPKGKNSSKSPDVNEIKNVLEYIGTDKIELDYPYITKKHPKVQIDLNAIAKGYAVDIIHDWLIHKNYKNIYVEIGGELRCSGVNKTGATWIIGIDTPINNIVSSKNIYSKTKLKNMSLATSGNYRNFLEKNGKKINHTIDPRNGISVESNILSVSVKARSCLVADAWATALMILPYDEGLKVATEAGGLEVLWIFAEGKEGFSQFSTKGFYRK